MANRHNIFSSLDKPAEEKPEFRFSDSESNQAALQKILLNRAETCEEKFKILDARDKLYKLMQYKIPTLKREALSATCPDMCPEKERLLREYQSRGSIFEMTNFSRNSTFNHSLAVKEYARSSADQEEPLPHDLRPISVLTMTMSHLLHNVADYCELTDDNLEDWYMFMWDRTRALRKELTQQGVCCIESVTIVEQCARFHIHCAERLVDQDSSIYDDKINTENLTKCLQTLKYMYKDLAKEDVKCPNEPEFVCYTLLLNLNNSSVFTELSDMSETLMASQPVKFALDLMTTWETRNYIRFFDLVKKTTYLNCCLLRRYFGEMRLYAIKTMIRSYCTKNYSPQMPISWFVNNLNFEGEEECLRFLSECNFNFREVDGMTVVNFNRLLFQNPQSTLTTGRAFIFIEEKKTRPLSVVLAGGSLPPKSYENHVPETSFTPSGNLKSSVLAKFDMAEVSSVPSVTLPSLFGDKSEKRGSTEGTTARILSSSAEMPTSTNIFGRETSSDSVQESGLPKTVEKSSFGSGSLFAKEETEPGKGLFTSVFSQNAGSSTFSFIAPEAQVKTIFEKTPTVNPFQTNVFGSKNSNFQSFGRFDTVEKQSQAFTGFSFGKPLSQPKQSEVPAPVSIAESSEKENSDMKTSSFTTFKFEPSESKVTIQDSSESLEKEKREEEERERERRRRLKEEEEEEAKMRGKIALEKEEAEMRARLMEEKRKAELEKRERERREKEERLKKEERDRLEREEKKRREEKEREEKRTRESEAKLKQLEENKRRKELDFRLKVEKEMKKLKISWVKWKAKIFFDKWRMKTWTRIEEKKMNKYFREVKLRYPPVCSEELLKSNPQGLIIPSTLIFEKFQNWRRELEYENYRREKKMFIVSDELPLLKLNSILGKILESRAKRFDCRTEPYPWKLLISVPDDSESPDLSKSIETFIEMHFVDDINWEFGMQKGPLYCRNGTHKTFQFVISVRKVKGCGLYEGNESNPAAIEGSNVIIFVLNGNGNEETRTRLKRVAQSSRPSPKVPVILFSLTDDANEGNRLTETLEVEQLQKSHLGECHVVPVINGKHNVVSRLLDCLHLAGTVSAPPSSLRLALLSEFFTESFLDSLWRRISISLSNFKIVLDEPKVVIEFYNACIDCLSSIFLEESYEKKSILGEEFREFKGDRPNRNLRYEEKVRKSLESIKLAHWPEKIPKSCHQLNYRIHQYCKKIVGGDRMKVKNLKWTLYEVIRRALLWKGLDIYCDEDVREILRNFPWIEVFQKISRVLLQRLKESVEKDDLILIYDLETLEKFSFEASLVSKFLKRSKRKTGFFHGEDECETFDPCIENDSIIYAYSMAVEKERNKRKRDKSMEEGLDELFSSPLEKRLVLEGTKSGNRKEEEEEEEEDERRGKEDRKFDLSQIECNFQSLEDKLERLKRQTRENESILMDIQCQLK